MADTATTPIGSGQPQGKTRNPLGQSLDFDIRGLGRLPRTEAPGGWVTKIERSREGIFLNPLAFPVSLYFFLIGSRGNKYGGG